MLMQRLCAVMSRTDRNAVRIEDRRDIMRMHALHRECHDAVMRGRLVFGTISTKPMPMLKTRYISS